MFEVELALNVDVQDAFDSMSVEDQIDFLKTNLYNLTDEEQEEIFKYIGII